MPIKNYKDPVRRFLSSVAEARIEADRQTQRLQRLEAQATKVTASLTGMPRGGGGDSENLLAVLADMRDQCSAAIVAAEQQVERVTEFIEKLENPVSRIILKLRYCDCLEWDSDDRPHQKVGRRRTVASEMQKAGLYYSRMQITRFHGVALNEARELYKKEYENDESRDT